MIYTFKGNLCGIICPECCEPLSYVKVRLYRSRKEQNVTALAVANAKDTFSILTDDEIKAKESSLLAEVMTDEFGNFNFQLGENQKYNGEAFEIDVYCETVPHRKTSAKPPKPLQFSITILQPIWKETENGAFAVFQYCIPNRFWCAVRRRFDAWVICGIVTVCDSKTAVMGVTVNAYDSDWLQDDPLGTATTDAFGKFRIDYLTEDFKKTPFSPLVNFEWIGGPDVYFKVLSPDSTPLLVEPSSKGRSAGRENISNCFCVDLCLREAPPVKPPTIPLFTNVGAYLVDPLDANFTSEGLTTAGNFAFTDTIPLIGILPDGQNPTALEYRFRIAQYDDTGAILGPVTDVDVNKISATNIGKLEYWRWNSILTAWEVKAADYWVNNPGASVSIPQPVGPPLTVDLNKNVAADGWISVPREDALIPGGVGRFIPNGNLAFLITNKYTDESFNLTLPAPGLNAGESVPAASKVKTHTYKIFFEARNAVTHSLEPGSNSLNKIVFCNTHYTFERHPNWAGYVTSQRDVVSLDIKELTGGSPGAGCGKLQNHLHALFTVYHPFVESARVYFEGNAPLPPAFSLTITGGEAASGAGGHDFDITLLEPCAYVLWLEATLNLTSGWGRISGATSWDHIAFCKS